MTQQSQEGYPQYQQNQGYPYKKCIFCLVSGPRSEGGHRWKDCPNMKDPTKRRNKFGELNLCLGCGSNRHIRVNCKSTFRCRIAECGLHHHESLHEWYIAKKRYPKQSAGDSPWAFLFFPLISCMIFLCNMFQKPQVSNHPKWDPGM